MLLLSVVLGALALVLGFLYFAENSRYAKLIQQASIFNAIKDENLSKIKSLNENLHYFQNLSTQLINEKQTIQDEKTRISLETDRLTAENAMLYKARHELESKVSALQTALATASEKLASEQKRLTDEKRFEEQFLQKAVFHIKNISTEMLHSNNKTTQDLTKITEQRAGEVFQKSQEATQKITEELMKKFEDASKAINYIGQKSQMHEKDLHKILDIFKSGHATGVHGEMILENTLLSCGFEHGRDFELQYSTEGGQYKPDAVVFLASDEVMVIDSKSSQFFLADDNLSESERMQKIKASMQNHIKTLANKSYKPEVIKSLKKTHKKDVRKIYLFMFLPSEVFIENVIKAMPLFYSECRAVEIYPCGPVTLSYAIDITKFAKRQEAASKNLEEIMLAVKELISRSEILEKHANGVLEEYTQMGKKLTDFQTSLASRFTPKKEQILKLMDGSSVSQINLLT